MPCGVTPRSESAAHLVKEASIGLDNRPKEHPVYDLSSEKRTSDNVTKMQLKLEYANRKRCSCSDDDENRRTNKISPSPSRCRVQGYYGNEPGRPVMSCFVDHTFAFVAVEPNAEGIF